MVLMAFFVKKFKFLARAAGRSGTEIGIEFGFRIEFWGEFGF